MLKFYISAFLADMALGNVLLSLSLLLIHKFDASSLTLGIFGSLGATAYSLGVITTGRLADRIDKKRILLAGCVLFIAAYSIIPFLPGIKATLAVYIAGSFSMSLFWPVIQSWLSQGLDRKKLLRSLTNFNVFWSAGLMVGFFSAGVLFSLSPAAPFALGSFIILAVIFILSGQPVISEAAGGAAHSVFIQTENDRPHSAKMFLCIAWAANFTSWFIHGSVRNLFPRLGVELGFASGSIGFFIFLSILAQTLMFVVLGSTKAWHYKIFPIMFFQALALAGLFIIVSMSGAAYLAVAMVLLGLSSGMTYFSSIFYSLYGFIDKGAKSGLHESFIGMGALFGPLVGGVCANSFGVRAPYLAAAFLLAAAMAVEAFLYRRGAK